MVVWSYTQWLEHYGGIYFKTDDSFNKEYTWVKINKVFGFEKIVIKVITGFGVPYIGQEPFGKIMNRKWKKFIFDDILCKNLLFQIIDFMILFEIQWFHFLTYISLLMRKNFEWKYIGYFI